jgi:hypothetical protein
MEQYTGTKPSPHTVMYNVSEVESTKSALKNKITGAVYETTGSVLRVLRNTPSPFGFFVSSPPNFVSEEREFVLEAQISPIGIARRARALSPEKMAQSTAAAKLEALKRQYKMYASLLKTEHKLDMYTSCLRGCVISLKDMFTVSADLSDSDSKLFIITFLKWTTETNKKVAKSLSSAYTHLNKYVQHALDNYKGEKRSEKMKKVMFSTLMENFLECSEALKGSHLKSPVTPEQVQELILEIYKNMNK